VNVSWLSITALQAGLTLADMLPKSVVFVNIRSIPSEGRTKKYFHHYF